MPRGGHVRLYFKAGQRGAASFPHARLVLPLVPSPMDSLNDTTEYKALLESIRSVYGYYFTDYAESLVKRRITNFMNNKGLTTLDKLGTHLLNDESIFEEFVQGLSITVTEMFRDPSFYKSLRENVLIRLATYPVVKIWLAGCANGVEADVIAILVQ